MTVIKGLSKGRGTFTMPPFVPITAHGTHSLPPDIPRDGSFTYIPPTTTFFKKDGPSMLLGDMSNYAEAERLNHLMGGGFLEYAAKIPLIGRLLYSPGGAAVVERANETGRNRNATGRAFRAGVFSPATAILGLGTMREDEMGAINAGNGHPIMAGKSLYFLLTAGVSADHVTVRTPFTVAHVEMYIEELAEVVMGKLEKALPEHEVLKDSAKKQELLKVLNTHLIEDGKGQERRISGRLAEIPSEVGKDRIEERLTFFPFNQKTRVGIG